MEKGFSFTYKADLDHNLGEYEFDHVFIGKYDGEIRPNRSEVEEFRWTNLDILRKDIEKHPDDYTAWLKIVFNKVLEFVDRS